MSTYQILSAAGKIARKSTLAQFQEQVDIAELMAAHREKGAVDSGSFNTLMAAMRNRSAPDRVGIGKYLLDQGWQVVSQEGQVNELLVLMSSSGRQPELEAPLVERLLAGGCDPNSLERRGDRPLWLLFHNRKTDEELAPLYEVFFSCDHLDFTRQDNNGDSVYRRLLTSHYRSWRQEGIRRVREYLREHGQDVPRLGEDPRRNFPV